MKRASILLALALASIFIALALVGRSSDDREAEITHCHLNGYYAKVDLGVWCCSNLNGESWCLAPHEITKHRRETWPQ